MSRIAVVLESVVLSSFLVACGDAGSPSSAAPPTPKEVVKISAGQLFNAYEENEVATDEGFKNKLIQVSGSVQAISKDAFDNIVIDLKTSNQFMPVHMKMEDTEKAAAVALKKGTKTTVLCESMSRIIGAPYGNGCRFVAEEAKKPAK